MKNRVIIGFIAIILGLFGVAAGIILYTDYYIKAQETSIAQTPPVASEQVWPDEGTGASEEATPVPTVDAETGASAEATPDAGTGASEATAAPDAGTGASETVGSDGSSEYEDDDDHEEYEHEDDDDEDDD